jgi:AcrR family transcriptional regulator
MAGNVKHRVSPGAEHATPVETDGRRERWREHRERRRIELIDAAFRALAEHGPQARMEQIAAAAGIAKPKLYRHFTDRDDLVAAIGARVAQEMLERVGAAVDLDLSLRDGISVTIDAYLSYVEKHPSVIRFLMENAQPDGQRAAPIVDNARLIAALVAAIAAADLEAVHVPIDGAQPLAHAMIGALLGATDWWLLQEDETRMPRARLVEHLTLVLVGSAQAVLASWNVDLDPDEPGVARKYLAFGH